MFGKQARLTNLVSVTLLLCSEEPLMKRGLSTGGTALMSPPIPLNAAESAYQTVVETLGLAGKSPGERIKSLVSIPAEHLWQKVPQSAFIWPAIDTEIITGTPTFNTISSKQDRPAFPMPGRKWCKALMLGDSQLDGNILAFKIFDAHKANIAQAFTYSVTKTLASHPEAAHQLLASYEIAPTTSDDEALLAVLRFVSEIAFYAPGRAFAQGWPSDTPDSKAFLYHFNEGMPFPGRFQGEAVHMLDIGYLFQNFNAHLSDEQRKVARAFGEDFIKFVSGQDPWPAVQEGKLSARVYGPSSEGNTCRWSGTGTPAHVGRDERVLRLAEAVGFDGVAAVFYDFMKECRGCARVESDAMAKLKLLFP